MQPVHDFVGNEIKVGSEIVYASLLGRSAGLARGEVLEIVEGNPNSYAKTKVTLKVQRKKADGTLEMKQKFVYGADLGSGHYVDTGPSTSRLQFVDRVVVINN